jgi:hypothetical protein
MTALDDRKIMFPEHRGLPHSTSVKDKSGVRAAHFDSVVHATTTLVTAMTKFVVAVAYLVVNFTDLITLLI